MQIKSGGTASRSKQSQNSSRYISRQTPNLHRNSTEYEFRDQICRMGTVFIHCLSSDLQFAALQFAEDFTKGIVQSRRFIFFSNCVAWNYFHAARWCRFVFVNYKQYSDILPPECLSPFINFCNLWLTNSWTRCLGTEGQHLLTNVRIHTFNYSQEQLEAVVKTSGSMPEIVDVIRELLQISLVIWETTLQI